MAKIRETRTGSKSYGFSDIPSRETYISLVNWMNDKNLERFTSIPYKHRIIFLPQCLRNIERCQAKELGGRYECRKCGSCKINLFINEAEKLKYQGTYILKGGSVVPKILDKAKPSGVIGVACDYEGSVGMMECNKRSIPSQVVPLSKDGCADTDVDTDEVLKLMSCLEIKSKMIYIRSQNVVRED